MRAFTGLGRQAAKPQLRHGHRLPLGPWSSETNPGSRLGEVGFGPEATAENDIALPLAHDLEVTGPVVVRWHASSSALDADLVARLTDVYPDGRSLNVTEGVVRARYRQGIWSPPMLLEPGRPRSSWWPCR